MPDVVRVLNIHVGYACRNSGACCSARWRIPVEPDVGTVLAVAAANGRLPAGAARTETDGHLTVMALAADGATCTAFEPPGRGALARCAIHRVLGHAALPSACRHFPRVCLLDPRGVSITLSHYCPTAAALLFTGDTPLAVVENPPGFEPDQYEGLDAREALPPLLRPGLLMDLESYAAWEAWALGVLDDAGQTPERALGTIAASVEYLRTWKPGQGALLSRVLELSSVPELGTDPRPGSDPVERADPNPGSDTVIRRFREVLGCVPDGLARTERQRTASRPATDLARVDQELVAASWRSVERPLRRYVAAKLHGSWVAYQGQGLRTVAGSLSAALAVVRVEAIVLCERAGRPLDRALAREAVRAADRLLVHEADSDRLARVWSAAEQRP